MVCNNCGTVFEDGKKSCPVCGTPVELGPIKQTSAPMFCARCGTELFASDVFCPTCGTPKVNSEDARGGGKYSDAAQDTSKTMYAEPPEYSKAAEDAAPADKEKNTTLLIVLIVSGAVIVLAILAVCYTLFWSGGNGGNGSSGGSSGSAVTSRRRDEDTKRGSKLNPEYRPTPTPAPTPTPTPVPSPTPAPEYDDYILDKMYIYEEDLYGMGKEETRLLINEMYARHGFRFTDEKYKSYFEAQPWYHPNTDSLEEASSRFNIYEEENIKVLAQYETDMGWR